MSDTIIVPKGITYEEWFGVEKSNLLKKKRSFDLKAFWKLLSLDDRKKIQEKIDNNLIHQKTLFKKENIPWNKGIKSSDRINRNCHAWQKDKNKLQKAIEKIASKTRGRTSPLKGSSLQTLTCSFCGKIFQREKWRSRDTKDVLCSTACRNFWSVKRLPKRNLKRIEQYTLTIIWKKIRRKILLRDDHRCQICNSPRNLIVHHIIPFRTFSRHVMENLITLCRSCHCGLELPGYWKGGGFYYR